MKALNKGIKSNVIFIGWSALSMFFLFGDWISKELFLITTLITICDILLDICLGIACLCSRSLRDKTVPTNVSDSTAIQLFKTDVIVEVIKLVVGILLVIYTCVQKGWIG